MNKLKSWWFEILGMLLVVLDFGFDVVNPVLLAIGLDAYYIGVIKSIFGVYGIVKLSINKPKVIGMSKSIVGGRPNDR